MKPETMSSKTGPYTVEEVYADGRKNPTYRIVGPTDDNGSSWSLLAMEGECHRLNAAYMAGQESSRWIPVTEENQPERNSTVIYWHKSLLGGEGFPEIAHEWRWEHHGEVATHFLSAPMPPNT